MDRAMPESARGGNGCVQARLSRAGFGAFCALSS